MREKPHLLRKIYIIKLCVLKAHHKHYEFFKEEKKMSRRIMLFAVVFTLLAIYSNIAFCKMDPPFNTPPIDADNLGVGWGSAYYPTIGHLPHAGYENLIIGSAAGSILTLQFQNPFTDGSGNDFAIRTSPSNIGWGYLADQAEFSFYMDNTFAGSFISQLNMPSTTFTFELPGQNLIANKICIKNLATYQGNWDDTSITYVDAGVAYSVPEPATLFLLGFGGLTLLRKRRT